MKKRETIEEIRREAEASFSALLTKKKPLLEGKEIPELKGLWNKVNDKKWEVSRREPFTDRDLEAMHRLALFEIVIKCVIGSKRRSINEQR